MSQNKNGECECLDIFGTIENENGVLICKNCSGVKVQKRYQKGSDAEEVFARYFRDNMRENNVHGFKRAYPTLYNRVIIPAMKDMSNDTRSLIETVHYNACCAMIENCRKEWKMTGGFSYPLHPPIDTIKKI